MDLVLSYLLLAVLVYVVIRIDLWIMSKMK